VAGNYSTDYLTTTTQAESIKTIKLGGEEGNYSNSYSSVVGSTGDVDMGGVDEYLAERCSSSF
jgi:hypothetical protein